MILVQLEVMVLMVLILEQVLVVLVAVIWLMEILEELVLVEAEVIHKDGPWRGLEDVERATLTWVEWFNNRRLLRPIGDLPPAEFEMMYHQQTESSNVA